MTTEEEEEEEEVQEEDTAAATLLLWARCPSSKVRALWLWGLSRD